MGHVQRGVRAALRPPAIAPILEANGAIFPILLCTTHTHVYNLYAAGSITARHGTSMSHRHKNRRGRHVVPRLAYPLVVNQTTKKKKKGTNSKRRRRSMKTEGGPVYGYVVSWG